MSEDGNELANNAFNKKPNRLSIAEFRHTKTEANVSAQSYVESLNYQTPEVEISKTPNLQQQTMLFPVLRKELSGHSKRSSSFRYK